MISTWGKILKKYTLLPGEGGGRCSRLIQLSVTEFEAPTYEKHLPQPQGKGRSRKQQCGKQCYLFLKANCSWTLPLSGWGGGARRSTKLNPLWTTWVPFQKTKHGKAEIPRCSTDNWTTHLRKLCLSKFCLYVFLHFCVIVLLILVL